MCRLRVMAHSMADEIVAPAAPPSPQAMNAPTASLAGSSINSPIAVVPNPLLQQRGR